MSTIFCKFEKRNPSFYKTPWRGQCYMFTGVANTPESPGPPHAGLTSPPPWVAHGGRAGEHVQV